MSSGDESLTSEDSMPSLIVGEGYDMFDMDPYVHEDQEGLMLNANRRQWTDLVVAEIAT